MRPAEDIHLQLKCTTLAHLYICSKIPGLAVACHLCW